jgi:alkylhydroperoxidase/carboxymuconolactone decarboxylase family protein YurZ
MHWYVLVRCGTGANKRFERSPQAATLTPQAYERRSSATRSMHHRGGPVNVSDAFQVFLTQTPEHAKAWMEAVKALEEASALDDLTGEIAYIAVLSALRMTSGIPFHVAAAKSLGATREQIASAVLVGLPATGNAVTQSLPVALDAFDAASD